MHDHPRDSGRRQGATRTLRLPRRMRPALGRSAAAGRYSCADEATPPVPRRGRNRGDGRARRQAADRGAPVRRPVECPRPRRGRPRPAAARARLTLDFEPATATAGSCSSTARPSSRASSRTSGPRRRRPHPHLRLQGGRHRRRLPGQARRQGRGGRRRPDHHRGGVQPAGPRAKFYGSLVAGGVQVVANQGGFVDLDGLLGTASTGGSTTSGISTIARSWSSTAGSATSADPASRTTTRPARTT